MLKWFHVFLEQVWGRSHFLEMHEITLVENIDNEEETQFGDDINIEKWNKVDGSEMESYLCDQLTYNKDLRVSHWCERKSF